MADEPRNAISGRTYRGINPIVLRLTAEAEGYGDPRWLTYRQSQAAGGHIRRGERGTRIVFWKFIEREDGGGEPRRFPLLRTFTVFNAEQCEGLELAPIPPRSRSTPWRPRRRC